MTTCECQAQCKFNERDVRVCSSCGKPSQDQRSPLEMACAMSHSGGLVGALFSNVADCIALDGEQTDE